jgi:hypothetical protein
MERTTRNRNRPKRWYFRFALAVPKWGEVYMLPIDSMLTRELSLPGERLQKGTFLVWSERAAYGQTRDETELIRARVAKHPAIIDREPNRAIRK